MVILYVHLKFSGPLAPPNEMETAGAFPPDRYRICLVEISVNQICPLDCAEH